MKDFTHLRELFVIFPIWNHQIQVSTDVGQCCRQVFTPFHLSLIKNNEDMLDQMENHSPFGCYVCQYVTVRSFEVFY